MDYKNYTKPDGQGGWIDYRMGDFFKGPWGNNNGPNHDQLLSIGYKPLVYPTPAQYERVDKTTRTDIGGVVEYGKTSWSQEEIDAAVLSEENGALLIVLQANAELAYWIDKTPADITTLIANQPNSWVGVKQIMEKNSQAVAVMTKLFKLLRDTGRI